jgi:hypothetical protein
MRIERHVFGSYKGYTTLARSPGISPEDCEAIESTAYSFGQSNDVKFLQSLISVPAYYTQVMRNGRRALTRVLPGPPDDNGRPTLRLVTAILQQRDWDNRIYGDISLLLEEPGLWEWDHTLPLVALETTLRPPAQAVPGKSVAKLLALLSGIENGFRKGQGIVVSAAEYSLQEIAAVEMLVPPDVRPRITSAYRSLSAAMPATLNCLASEASSQQDIMFHYRPGEERLSPYAEYLSQSGFSSGAIPWESIMSYGGFGTSPRRGSTSKDGSQMAVSPPVTVVQRWPLLPIAATVIVALLLSLGAFLAAYLAGERQARNLENQLADLKAWTQQQQGQFEASLRRMQQQANSTAEKLESLKGSIIEDVENRLDSHVVKDAQALLQTARDNKLRLDTEEEREQHELQVIHRRLQEVVNVNPRLRPEASELGQKIANLATALSVQSKLKTILQELKGKRDKYDSLSGKDSVEALTSIRQKLDEMEKGDAKKLKEIAEQLNVTLDREGVLGELENMKAWLESRSNSANRSPATREGARQ